MNDQPQPDVQERTAWARFQNDFNAMSDAEIAEVTRDEQAKADEAEDWLEAVASWETAGRPRSTQEQSQ